MNSTFYKGVVLGAVTSALVVAGAAAYAATGGNFILGQPNTASSTSGLRADLPTTPALDMSNQGGGPAASFETKNTAAPFTVNSKTKVANLNAAMVGGKQATAFLPVAGKAADSDKLDGLDSGVFVQGIPANPGYATPTGQTLFAREHEYTRSADKRSLMTVPGFPSIDTQCLSNGLTVVSVTNAGSTPLPLFFTREISDVSGTNSLTFYDMVKPNNTLQMLVLDGFANGELRLQLGSGENSPTGERLFSGDFFVNNTTDECIFQGSGLLQTT